MCRDLDRSAADIAVHAGGNTSIWSNVSVAALPLLQKARCRGASYTYKVSEFKEQWGKFIRKRGGVEGGMWEFMDKDFLLF
jgi:hypothetical protein